MRSLSKVDIWDNLSCTEYVCGRSRSGGNPILMILYHLKKKYLHVDNEYLAELAFLINDINKLNRLIKLKQFIFLVGKDVAIYYLERNNKCQK